MIDQFNLIFSKAKVEIKFEKEIFLIQFFIIFVISI